MLIVKDCIISEDIRDKRFACDLEKCKGQCCVEGDCGAPLDEAEIPILKEIMPQVEPYMTDAGRKVVHKEGVSALDNAGEPCTPLVSNRECAYVVWGEEGTAYCAIERAYREGKTAFLKPISCHLYPLRVDVYGQFTAINFHDWDVCHCCCHSTGKPLYECLREPLIRRFGQDWYDELMQTINNNNPND